MTSLLDEEDKQTIDEMIERGEALRPDLIRAESAGLDVGDQKEKLDKSLARLRAIKGAFFPNS